MSTVGLSFGVSRARAALLFATALSGVWITPSFAQTVPTPVTSVDSTDGEGGKLETIVVTAQKRVENLQDTPISISVLTSRSLENRRVGSLLDLGDGAIPSLSVKPFFTRPGALIINIRGVGVMTDSNQPARDQGVGVYIDGVYMGRPQGLGSALYEVSSIEVLKGPQGTLFGRNTAGGAVNITTRKPSGTYRAEATAGIGNFGSYKTELRVDLPEFNNVSLKLDAVIMGRDGFVKNPLKQASDYGELYRGGLRLGALWEPTEAFTVEYAFDTSFDESTTIYQQLIAGGSARLPELNVLQPRRAKTGVIAAPQEPSSGDQTGHRITMEWAISDTLKLKSISAYRDMYQDQWDNASPTAFTSLSQATNFTGQSFSRVSTAEFVQDQTSHEVQLLGDLPRLKYVVGATYFVENVADNAQAFFTNRFTNATGTTNELLAINYDAIPFDRVSNVESTSTGIFAQGTFTPAMFGDKFHITLGGRYSHDEKVGALTIVNGRPPSVNGVVGPQLLNYTDDRFDPMVNLSYDFTDNIMAYAKYSTGFRSGGANSRSLTYSPFGPEEVEVFELGAKAELFDRSLRLNASIYSGIYTGIQLDFSARYIQTDPVTGLTLVTTRTTQEAANAPGEGKISGLEFDMTWALNDNLMISSAYAYNKVEIPDTSNPFPQANGRIITTAIPIRQTNTPENSGSISLDYRRPFMNATLIGHLSFNGDDGYYSSRTDVTYDPVTNRVLIPAPKGDGGIVANGRLALADIDLSGKAKLTVSLWARNLFNEERLFWQSLDPVRGLTGFFTEPRTYGLDFKVKM
jgi:iron complex outermembrane recepter protein